MAIEGRHVTPKGTESPRVRVRSPFVHLAVLGLGASGKALGCNTTRGAGCKEERQARMNGQRAEGGGGMKEEGHATHKGGTRLAPPPSYPLTQHIGRHATGPSSFMPPHTTHRVARVGAHCIGIVHITRGWCTRHETYRVASKCRNLTHFGSVSYKP